MIDETISVADEDALETARLAAKREGILAGISAGANIKAALEVAARPEMAGKRVVTIVCDSGERYMSLPFFLTAMRRSLPLLAIALGAVIVSVANAGPATTGELTQKLGTDGCVAVGGGGGACGQGTGLGGTASSRSARTGATSTRADSRAARSPSLTVTRPPANWCSRMARRDASPRTGRAAPAPTGTA